MARAEDRGPAPDGGDREPGPVAPGADLAAAESFLAGARTVKVHAGGGKDARPADRPGVRFLVRMGEAIRAGIARLDEKVSHAVLLRTEVVITAGFAAHAAMYPSATGITLAGLTAVATGITAVRQQTRPSGGPKAGGAAKPGRAGKSVARAGGAPATEAGASSVGAAPTGLTATDEADRFVTGSREITVHPGGRRDLRPVDRLGFKAIADVHRRTWDATKALAHSMHENAVVTFSTAVAAGHAGYVVSKPDLVGLSVVAVATLASSTAVVKHLRHRSQHRATELVQSASAAPAPGKTAAGAARREEIATIARDLRSRIAGR